MQNSFFQKFQQLFEILDKKTIHLINNLNYFSIFLEIISLFVMFLHYKLYISRLLFYISINIFITSIILSICGYIFGITINKYKQNHT